MILNTLYTVFKGNTDDLKKSEKEAESSTKKYQDSLKAVDETAKKLGESLGDVFKTAAKTVASLVSAGAIIHGIKSATEYSLHLADVSKSLNANVQTLELWQRAVQRSGGSAEGFTSTVKGLSEKFNLSANNIIRSLPQIANLFSRLSNLQARKLASQIGIDEGTMYLLQRGSKGIQEIIQKQKELGVITKKDTDTAKAFRLEWDDVTTVFRNFFVQVATDVLPVVTKFAHLLTELGKTFVKHKELIYAAGMVLVGFLTARLVPALLEVAASEWAMLAPALPFIIGLTLLAGLLTLVTEDLMGYSKGYDSVTGSLIKLVKESPNLLRFFTGLQITVQTLKMLFDRLIWSIETIWTWLKKLGSPEIVSALEKVNKAIGNFFTGKKSATLETNKTDNQLTTQALKQIKDQNPFNDDKLKQTVQTAKSQIDFAVKNRFTSTPIGGGIPGAENKTVNFTIQNMEVQTNATDADSFSREVDSALRRQITQALNNSASGVMI